MIQAATPPGAAWAVQWPARSGAPPTRAVTSTAVVRCAPVRRAVPAEIEAELADEAAENDEVPAD